MVNEITKARTTNFFQITPKKCGDTIEYRYRLGGLLKYYGRAA
jgi:hypothetical protein